MAERQITTLHFIDDSSDEHLITRILLKRARLDLDYQGYETPQMFFDQIDALGADAYAASIIVVDLNLIVDSGIDVVRRIQADERFKQTIVGICTGSEDPADRQNAIQAGADFFVTKPLDRNAINAIAQATARLSFKDGPDGSTKLYEHPTDENS